jgi:hypothetical protein
MGPVSSELRKGERKYCSAKASRNFSVGKARNLPRVACVLVSARSSAMRIIAGWRLPPPIIKLDTEPVCVVHKAGVREGRVLNCSKQF